jgi:beta-lactam-binding protein with PASTA domain
MAVKARSWFRILVVFMVVTLIFIVVMDQFVLPQYVFHGKELTMVDVSNRSYTEAKNILSDVGFQAVVIDTLENS